MMYYGRFSFAGSLILLSLITLINNLALINTAAAQTTFSIPLEGAQHVPPITTEATGHCVGVLSVDQSTFSVTCTHDVQGTTASHIHAGVAGENGGIIFPFDSPESPISQSFEVSPDEVTTLLAGGFYVNVHSQTNAEGEIRGQITGPAEKSLSFVLSGSQAVPPVATQASGQCSAALDNATLAVSCTHNVQEVSAAHIHDANAGINGGVLLPFSSPDSPIIEVFDLFEDEVAKLKSQNLYVNVHSEAFPGGEVRGQMAAAEDTAFNFVVSGIQAVPAVQTEASGQCTAVLNQSENELAVSCNHTVQEATAAHIHDAPAGSAGGVLIPFSSPDSPIIEVLQISAASVELLKARGLYVNVHTEANPAGEIRGQINRTPDGTYAGTYYDSSRSGEGILLEITGDPPVIVLTWYSYTPDGTGNQIFLIGSAPVLNNQAVVPMQITSGAMFGDDFDADDVLRTDWGTLTITFVSCTRAIIEYSGDLPGYGSGVLTQTRLTPPLSGVGTCK